MLPSSNPLVLVADDEPSMLELVARHLKTMDDPKLEVLEASDGDQAWQLAREHLPDLVVLDVMMPGMSGWEVCRKIREDVALAHTGVVMLTGIGENLNQMTSPLYGADAYIDKPFEFDELDEKVKNALSARAAQREGVTRPTTTATTNVNGVAGPAQAAQGGQGRQVGGATRSKAPAKKKTAATKPLAKAAPRSTGGTTRPAPKSKAGAKKAPATKTIAKKAGAKKAPGKAAAKARGLTTKAKAKVTATKKSKQNLMKGETKMAAKKTAKKTAAKKAPAKKTTAKKTAKKKAK